MFDTPRLKKLDKKVITVSLYHHPQRIHGQFRKLGRHEEMNVYFSDHTLAYVTAGVRAKFAAPVAQGMPWDLSLKFSLPDRIDEKSYIREFEANLPEGVVAELAGVESRVWDRLVLRLTGMDAEAVQWYIAEKLNLALPTGQVSDQIETSSPSRWTHLKTFDWMVPKGEDYRFVRELLVVNASWASNWI
ncbi:MAG: hypothetical protein R2827_15485 [Bdellovibrionales bacterium]